MQRRILSIILVFSMLFSILPTFAVDLYAEQEEDLEQGESEIAPQEVEATITLEQERIRDDESDSCLEEPATAMEDPVTVETVDSIETVDLEQVAESVSDPVSASEEEQVEATEAEDKGAEEGDELPLEQGFIEQGLTEELNRSIPEALSQDVETLQEVELISTADEVIALAHASWGEQEEVWSKTYQLANDIDMKDATSEKAMKPIGNSSRPFTGVLDGQGHTIKNLQLHVSSGGGGLFHSLSSTATVKNLQLEDANLQFDGESGALVGKSSGTVEHCAVVNSTITATSSVVGGLVGVNDGRIERSFIADSTLQYDGKFSTTSYGGLVGRNARSGSLDQSYATVTIDAQKWTGGFVGWNEGSITNSYSTGVIQGTEEIGGLVGRSSSTSSIVNAYANVNVIPTVSGSGFIGGLQWGNGGTVTNGYYNTAKKLPAESSAALAGVKGITVAELQSADVLAALNQDGAVWGQAAKIDQGFPYLVAIAPEPSEQETPGGIHVKIMVATYDREHYRFETHRDVTELQIEREEPTLLDVLEASKKTLPYTSSMGKYGEFIESIDGIEASAPDGWMFTINDQTPPVGVSTATVKDGDQILWYYGTPLNNYQGPTWDQLLATSSEQGKEVQAFTGKGTEAEPYLIKTVADLQHIMDYPQAHFKVNNPIDLKGVAFEPIGSEATPFMGTFDGNHQEIANLTINKDKDSKNVGFFGVLSHAKVVNVKLIDAQIVGGSRLGVLAGSAMEERNGSTLIGNCHVSGTITGLGTDVAKATRIGGLVGVNDGNNDNSYRYSVIDHCSADVEVIGNTTPADEAGHVGGLVGWNRGIISNSSATGNVKGGNTTGGLVGSNWGQIYTSHATGHVTGEYTTGGFAGSSNLYSKIEDSYSTGNVIGSQAHGNSYFGGFIGHTSGMIKNCVSVGTVLPGWSWNGGFSGYYDGGSIEKNLENSYGNSTDVLGRSMKGLGNVIDATHADYDRYRAVGVTPALAKAKLELILGVTLPSRNKSEDRLAVEAEVAQYASHVVIPNTVAADSDVTQLIVKPLEGSTIDPEIVIVYSQKEYTGYITDHAPTGQYTLLKQKTSEGNEETSVTLIFVKNGEWATKEIAVTIESTQSIDTTVLKEKITAIAGQALQAEAYTEESWHAFKEAYVAAQAIVEQVAPTHEEVVVACSKLTSALENLKPKVASVSPKERLGQVLASLRSYYTQQTPFTFRVAMGYHITSTELEQDLPLIAQRFQVNPNPESASAYTGNIMGLIAAGKNPYAYQGQDYVTPLAQAQNESGKFIIGKYDDYSTAVAFSMLALDMANGKYDREKAVQALLSYQQEDGSFGGVDETAMSIMALGSHREMAGVDTAITKGVAYLQASQQASGGFEAWGAENPYSISAVIQGLIAIGEDPLAECWTKNGNTMLDALLQFQEDDHFVHHSEWSKEPEVAMATEQAFLALADLERGASIYHQLVLALNQEPVRIVIEQPASSTLKEQGKLQLRAHLYDQQGQLVLGQHLIWTSADQSIATVDQDGVVVAKQSGAVTITVQAQGYDEMKARLELTVQPEEFSIKHVNHGELKNGAEARLELLVQNNEQEAKTATLIIVLYDRATNRMLNYSFVKEDFAPAESKRLGAGFLIPDQGRYKVKSFVWHGFEDPNILLSNPHEVDVKE